MLISKISPRRYQKEIAQSCVENNCLVVLPTGLGKTLISIMVSIEIMKKYPLKKILFLAPTKPLAEQQLESFQKNLGELYAGMTLFTGSVKPEKRKELWQKNEIIFSTPQCIANDLKKGIYHLKDVGLLIEDEAHRCVKNYDYNFVAQKLKEQSENPRIIGLTASPGSEPKKIKEICENLSIEKVELRTRESPDVKEYLQELNFEKIETELPKTFLEPLALLKEIYESYLTSLRQNNLVFGNVSKFTIIELQKKLMAQISRGYKNYSSYRAVSDCSMAIKIAHAIELLETQTLNGAHSYLKEIYNQAEKKKSKGVERLANKQEFNTAFARVNRLNLQGEEHPKIKEIIKIVRKEISEKKGSKIIIFAQYRETAKIISENINKLKEIKSKMFIGQAKKKETGLSQKEQKKIIDEFKNKEINIIVSTSIGEEGLDIPEVDTVIFYEPTSSAIRSIQRRGRTARLEKGKLIILITKNTKDQISHYASRSREKKMTKSIETIKKDLKNKEKQKKLI